MKVSFKDVSLADGTELHVVGLGVLVNGKTVEFSPQEIETFEALRGMKFDRAFANDKRLKIVKGGEDN